MRVTLNLIEKIVCEYNLIDLGSMFEKTRKEKITRIRQQFHYVAYSVLKGQETLGSIGAYGAEAYGPKKGRTHGSVLHSRDAFINRLSTDKELQIHTHKIVTKVRDEIFKREMVLLSAKAYFRPKIENLMNNMDKCKNNEEFDQLLINNLSSRCKKLIKG